MITMSEAEFQDAVDDALDSLPLDVIERVARANVVILVEDEPPEGQSILGVYIGVPLDKRGHFDAMTEPDRILIFRGPLQRLCHTRAQLVHEIRVTVLHEIGHLFGMDDARLHELGWG